MTSRTLIKRILKWSIAPLSVAILSVATLQPVIQAQPPSDNGTPANPDQQNGTQVLTRGPIHEAFGQPTVFNPKPGLLIPKKPPQVVEELPPDEKPEGDNVGWLGGYWSWEEDKNDFMWISGFWRVLPPGRQWIPGYWNENAELYQWVSGYWAGTDDVQQEVIAQAPPESLEQGAPPTAPSDEHIWAPGSWVYRESRYMWRPGYWIANQPGWAWIPSSYYWTPSGYIYVGGYWDWSIRRRGILFAPCYFDPVVVYRPGYYYRPTVCLDIDVITPHFFCRPSYGHYYFGDYYAATYVNVGITPWFNVSIGRGPRFYSCDFAYYECHYRRTNPNWVIQCRQNYDRCRDNVAYRPARTYVNQVTVINNININKQTNVNVNNMALAKPMKTYTANMAKNADAPMKFEKINDARARDFGKTAVDVRKIATERSNLEKVNVGGGPGSKTGGGSVTRTMNLPKSPIMSKVSSNTSVDNSTGSKVNVGSIGGQPGKSPPPIPGSSGVKPSRLQGNTGVVGSTGSGTGGNTKSGTTGTGVSGKTGEVGSSGVIGNTKSGTGGAGAAGTMDKTKSGTTGSDSPGKTGGSRIPPVKLDPSKGSGSSSGSGGAGSKSSGGAGGAGSKSSGGSSSGSSKKDKDK